MRYLTWDGMRLFQKPETAATFVVDSGMSTRRISQVKILQSGQLIKPEQFEIDELLAHVRDQTVF